MHASSQQRILVLTGTLGEGHNQAARAIAEAAAGAAPNAETTIVDYMKWTHPKLHSVGRFCYMQGIKGLPSVYGVLYRATREENRLSTLFKQLRTFRTERMLQLLEELRPTVVVCTFPAAAAAMSHLRLQRLTRVPTVTVLTDYARHSYWIHPGTDRYIVGAEPIRQALIASGVSPSRVVATGIPVRRQFGQRHDRAELRRKHGLDPQLPTILVMGGGDGLIGRSVMRLVEEQDGLPRAQFVIVCGRNERLRRQLQERLRSVGDAHRIVVTGYVPHVHELMAAADVMVTKPGGLTVSEALAQELPMILFKPIPGQEQENSAYLAGLGAALEASSRGELMDQLRAVLEHAALRDRLRRNASRHKPVAGASRALQAILELQDPRRAPADVAASALDAAVVAAVAGGAALQASASAVAQA
ncbi:glycosyltransferase [Paenibacillus sp. FSL W8-1187]|uniref:Diglucosyldiacylglycerol synthase (LTA membrane anchor synthesis) n=1 Tax=Paenibacillus pasadenensis TaxID=217090 RepID=A0A2N5NB17_9BACL|nr:MULTISPECIES: glycosyltransferase [Paenibacillus]PLT47551.1 diglucosyldiacylglycerol synthase (LTA membrane anchor synthesis) [Paenibacillus pasadenensis]